MTRSCTDAVVRFSAQAESDRRIAALVSSTYNLVWRSLRCLGVVHADADDACQQVFLVTYRRLSDIAPECERSFLLQTALRVAADFRRSRERRREEAGPDMNAFADRTANPEESLDQRQARAFLDRTLEAMPMDLRTVFVLFELDELTMAEIATVLDIPPGTVASRLRRARELFHDSASRLSGAARPETGGRP
jgi:RNA polymerase sigma-70 factor, ECF subfamily